MSSANRELQARLTTEARKGGCEVFFPDQQFCTDNGAMIALVGAHRLADVRGDYTFSVHPRWELATLRAPAPLEAIPQRGD